MVINEGVIEGEEARKFLEDVRVAFPQVLRVVKTRQATCLVLNHLLEYVKTLEKSGLLEEKEMLHLHDAVQTDLKKLLRNPPLVKAPKISGIHPMLGALPSSVCEPLARNSKEMMKLRGLTLYKWESKIIRNKHSFYPTFTHGTTLGLYEVLTGRPYICDVITDSLVLCFFLEGDKIVSCLKSDPSVEDFLWQESAIFLSKLLLPQIFEKMAMQNLRALVAERSIMTVYIRGETIEIPRHSIGILLEGYVKTQGLQELVTSPAALLHSHGSLSFRSSESSVSLVDTGIAISKKAGMIPLQMELGGKDACIVFEDADLDLAAANIVKGGFSYRLVKNPSGLLLGLTTGELQVLCLCMI